jgi:hypothetical protein
MNRLAGKLAVWRERLEAAELPTQPGTVDAAT